VKDTEIIHADSDIQFSVFVVTTEHNVLNTNLHLGSNLNGIT